MHSITTQTAEAVKAEMRRQDVTRDDLAAATGIPASTLDRFLDGKGSIHLDRLGLVAEALGVGVDRLTGRAA